MSPNSPFIVAVDGPAGSGKSSICHEVAQKFGFDYVNTGAIYRSIAYLVQQQLNNLSREEEIAKLAAALGPDLRWDSNSQSIYYKEENITDFLSSPETTAASSVIAKMPAVREALLEIQRTLGTQSPKGSIVDGRDIATIVFPEAPLKIFLTASLEERAKRRYEQLGSPEQPSLEEIKTEMAIRDERDASRNIAPLKKADDAVLVDTSGQSKQEVIEKMCQLIEEKI